MWLPLVSFFNQVVISPKKMLAYVPKVVLFNSSNILKLSVILTNSKISQDLSIFAINSKNKMRIYKVVSLIRYLYQQKNI